MNDQDWMQKALRLAARGEGWTSPNPIVGAVLVKNGRVIGEGWHEKCGTLHAERHALSRCTEDPAGSTLYVTLEPCCHTGRQPPCTQAILEAGIFPGCHWLCGPEPSGGRKGCSASAKSGRIRNIRRTACRM